MEQVLALYRGPFLPDEADQPAYQALREQLRARLLRQLASASRAWETQGHADVAVDAYQRLIDADPLFEAAYRQLMLCHQRRGDVFAARDVYERLRTTLSMRLRVMPSAQTQDLYATLAAAPH
jgi:DNA-binding SARP family transcriptional activator